MQGTRLKSYPRKRVDTDFSINLIYMPSINEILENESQNNGSFILLYPEGMFYKAYERSAWLACMYLGNLLVKKRYIKKVQQDVVSVGFPKSSIEKWAGGRNL